MTDTLTAPSTEAAIVAPVDVLDPKEAAAIATPTPVPADDPAASIADASRALREKAQQPKSEPVVGEQPRNPDGTFAPKDGTEPVVEAVAPDAEAPADEAPVESEAKVFVLKGESQRGESDIELDVAGLPPEVIERLERNEKQGMRRKEFEAGKAQLAKLQADLDAFETEISVDPVGVVLNHLAPAKRVDLGEVLLLEQWDQYAPMIQSLWEDEAGRMRRLNDLKSGNQSRRAEVATTVQATRAATAVRSAVATMVPDTADESTASEFYQTAIALLQSKLSQGEIVSPETVPTLLAAHRRRFFADASEAAANTPPARPKLAVKPSKAVAAVAPSSPTVVLAQDQVAAQMRARTAALATAKTGAGAGAVERPGGPPNETIEQASARLRALKGAR